MTEDGTSKSVLNQVEPSRRGFVKSVLAGAAFAAPVIASFSIENLAVDSAYGQSSLSSSAASSTAGSSGPCLPDLGYVGPASFQAYVLDISGSTRVNGEMAIRVRQDGGSADVRLRLTKGAVVTSAYLSSNGFQIANINFGDNDESEDRRDDRYSEGRIGPADLTRMCDFDSLLQALASRTVSAVVQGTHSYDSFNAQGAVSPIDGGPVIQTRG